MRHFGTKKMVTNIKKDIIFGFSTFKLAKKECFYPCTKIYVN